MMNSGIANRLTQYISVIQITLSGSPQDGNGPILAAGVVLERSGKEFYKI
jgi:hypothetical protein